MVFGNNSKSNAALKNIDERMQPHEQTTEEKQLTWLDCGL
jgi:hypothetical protein